MFKDLLLHFHTNLLLVLPCDAALKENLKMNYGACFSSAFFIVKTLRNNILCFKVTMF